MSDFSSAVSDDNRFSTSGVGLNTNLRVRFQHRSIGDTGTTTDIFPTPW